MLTIANCHYQTCDFYCGRAWKGYPDSALGNPFKGHGAIERYGDWLWGRIQAHDGPVLAALREIRYQHYVKIEKACEAGYEDETYALGCWCAPKPCHCSQIIGAINCSEVLAILLEEENRIPTYQEFADACSLIFDPIVMRAMKTVLKGLEETKRYQERNP